MILETKQAIADAVDGVAGVTGYANKPTVLKAGDAFVRWRGYARDAGDAFMAAYSVIVVLPAVKGEADADAWIYAHVDLLADALRPAMFVDTIEPTLMPAEGVPGGLFTLTITGRTES